MPELIPTERLQPSLLDRLTDLEPGQSVESREQRFFSVRRLRDCVLRDLGWLLNATAGEFGVPRAPEGSGGPGDDDDGDGDPFDAVARSTLCYGIPDLAGVCASTVDGDALARRVRQAIVDFEPRILPRTLSVRVATDEAGIGAQALAMKIEGELWAVPAPLRIVVNTSIDLESGRVVVADGAPAPLSRHAR